MSKVYNCARCKHQISRVVECCKICLIEFHPACIKFPNAHRVYDTDDKLVPCTGKIETFQIPTKEKREIKRKRTNSGNEVDEEERTMDYNDDPVEVQQNTLDAKFDSIVMKIEQMNESNIVKLKNEIKQECTVLKNSLEYILEDKLSKITTELYREMDKVKKSVAELSRGEVHNDQARVNQGYSSAVKKKDKNNKRTERLIVQPTDKEQNSAATCNVVQSIDIAELGIGVNRVINSVDGKIIIDVDKESEQRILAGEIQKKLGDVVTVTPVVKESPKLKIVNIDEKVLQMEDSELLGKLYKQNKIGTTSHTAETKIIKKYKTKDGFGSMLIEANPVLHKELLVKGRVKLGWKSYKIFNFVDMVRYYKCWRYNHFQGKCTRNVVCRKCAGNHTDKECDSETVNCVNCLNSVRKNKSVKCDTHHEFTSQKCPIFIKMIEKRRKNIVYCE